ncbi:MFS transporter [Amycolatopsis sp. NPDC088138]|uniref:MFS transporter n=1 Tax=Amycolatopsis sp. NPDC088138 TaxID=3363938 RepID=UPI0038305C6E
MDSTAPLEDTSPPESVPLLRNGNFQALWISRTFAAIGKEAADVAYPLLILATTGSAMYAGAVGSVQVLTVGLVSIPAGSLADRFDRRKLLLACDVVRAVLLALFGVLILLGQSNIFFVFTTAIISSACLGISNPPALAAIKQLVPPSQLTRATAQNQIRPLGATVVGSPIGTSLFGLGQAIPFLGTALTFVISAPLLLFIKRPMQPPATASGSRGGMVAGIRLIRREPIILVWTIWILGANMAFGHTGAFLAVIATGKSHGASDPLIGAALSIAGCGGLVGALFATWAIKRLRPSTILLFAAWVGPVVAILLITLPGTLTQGILLAVVFVRGPVANALFFAYVAVLVPDELQGRVLGAVMFAAYIGPTIGIFAVGSLFDLGGPTWVFVAMGVISALAALPTLTRRIRKLPAPEQLAA